MALSMILSTICVLPLASSNLAAVIQMCRSVGMFSRALLRTRRAFSYVSNRASASQSSRGEGESVGLIGYNIYIYIYTWSLRLYSQNLWYVTFLCYKYNAELQPRFMTFPMVVGNGGYLHTCRTTLHRTTKHDPGILGFFELDSSLPKPNRLGHIFQG